MLIAVIGKNWNSSADKDNLRRLDDLDDFVRIEIEAALQRGIRVIPVLVDGATMPKREDLPDSLQKLRRRQAIEISHNRFDSDVERLNHTLSLIEEELRQRKAAEAEHAAREEQEKREAAKAADEAEQARRLAEVEAQRVDAERRAREAAEVERAAREENKKRETAAAAKKAEQARRLPEVEAAQRADKERRAQEHLRRFREDAQKAEGVRTEGESVSAVAEPSSGAAPLFGPAEPARRSGGRNKLALAVTAVGAVLLSGAILLSQLAPRRENPPTPERIATSSSNAVAETPPIAAPAPATSSSNAVAKTPPIAAPAPAITVENCARFAASKGGKPWSAELADQCEALRISDQIQKDADQHREERKRLADELQKQIFQIVQPPTENSGKQEVDPGDVSGEIELGYRYYYGSGLSQSYPKAMIWYRKAAEKGDATAQYFIGVLYENGWGVDKDYVQAMVWFQKAAAQGNANAQTYIGYLYHNGLGIQSDYAQAMAWYRKAAHQGDAAAQYNIGVLYENGWGVVKDYAQAKAWYQMAADHGDAGAQTGLARLKSTPAARLDPHKELDSYIRE